MYLRLKEDWTCGCCTKGGATSPQAACATQERGRGCMGGLIEEPKCCFESLNFGHRSITRTCVSKRFVNRDARTRDNGMEIAGGCDRVTCCKKGYERVHGAKQMRKGVDVRGSGREHACCLVEGHRATRMRKGVGVRGSGRENPCCLVEGDGSVCRDLLRSVALSFFSPNGLHFLFGFCEKCY